MKTLNCLLAIKIATDYVTLKTVRFRIYNEFKGFITCTIVKAISLE